MMTPLLDLHEAADALRVSPETLDRLVADGLVPVVRLADDSVGFRPEDLLNLVDGEATKEGVMRLSAPVAVPIRWELDEKQVAVLSELSSILERHLPAEDTDEARSAVVAAMDGDTQRRVIELWAQLPTFPDVPQEFTYRGPAPRRLPAMTVERD